MYHAMASDRSYQQKKSPYQVCEELWQERNVTLQGSIVEAFIAEFAPLSIGNEVVLTNTLRGKVVFIDPTEPLRPTIQLKDTGELCSLRDDRTLTIDHLYAVT